MRPHLFALLLTLGCGGEASETAPEQTFGRDCQVRRDCPADGSWCSDDCGQDAPICYQNKCTFDCSVDAARANRCSAAGMICSDFYPVCHVGPDPACPRHPEANPFSSGELPDPNAAKQCTEYKTLDVVLFRGAAYRCTNATQREIPPRYFGDPSAGGYYLPCCCPPDGVEAPCQDFPELAGMPPHWEPLECR